MIPPNTPIETASTSSGSTNSGLLRGTSIVGGLTLGSRLLGFVRDLLVARLFGTSGFADAFYVAFRIPNLLRSVFAEGAMTSAFVPTFSSDLRQGHNAAQRTLSAITTLLICSTGLLSVIGIIFAPQLVDLIAPGFRIQANPDQPDRATICVMLTRLMLPYIIFVSLIAMLNGALNSVKIFGASAWAQIIMNLVLIVGALVAQQFENHSAAVVLAVSVIVGGFVQILAQIPAMRRSGFHLRLTLSWWTPSVREMLWLMLPAIMGAGIYQISIFLNTIFASLLEPGSVSWLYYADRITQLPIGVFSIALSSVLLPTLASAHARNGAADFSQGLIDSLRFTSFIILPVATAVGIFAVPITELLFQRGAFDANSTARTSSAVQALALGLWAVSCYSLVTRAFIARKDTKTPTLLGCGSLITTVLLSICLMGPPNGDEHGSLARFILAVQGLFSTGFELPHLGHVGLALASSCSATVMLFVGIMILRLRVSTIVWQSFAKSTLKTIICCSVAALVCIHASSYFSSHLSRLAVQGCAFFGILLITMKILKISEFQETIARIVRYMSARRVK